MSTPEEHRKGAKERFDLSLITISTSKYFDRERDDLSGKLARAILEKAGHTVSSMIILPDQKDMIRRELLRLILSDTDAIITSGGTGLTPDDLTIETIAPLFKKEITGFGELFRRLSYDKIGTASMLSRAAAGVIEGKLIICLPGSPDAVKLALEEIILPELPHLMRHIAG
ncbi:MAG: molybdenum cofactor biosynthesis protein MoaB [Candidatus Syntrophoarchaeum sp.]|nr:molybdenum cofactor biosynthesis protein MoaB [Candidatus Syntrophoarchaeum sp.]